MHHYNKTICVSQPLSRRWLTAENRIGDVVNDWRASIDLEPIPATEVAVFGGCFESALHLLLVSLIGNPNQWTGRRTLMFVASSSALLPASHHPRISTSSCEAALLRYTLGFGSVVIDGPPCDDSYAAQRSPNSGHPCYHITRLE